MSKPVYYLAILTIILLSACHRDSAKKELVAVGASDSVKFRMFCKAIENLRSAPDYVVVTVKNVTTGETKEVCTEIQFLNDAVRQETGAAADLDCAKYPTRYFEFMKDSALEVLNFSLYSQADLDKYAKTVNITDIVENVKTGKLTGKTFEGYGREQIMFAHVMFNNGVIMTRGQIIGNICSLRYSGKK